MPEIERHFHVKWAGPNTPYIRFCKNDERIYLSKRELVALAAEIESFTHYYRENFMEDRIDLEDDFGDEDGL
jgi:hypothetical protein